jgi:hypothetical protein
MGDVWKEKSDEGSDYDYFIHMCENRIMKYVPNCFKGGGIIGVNLIKVHYTHVWK